VRKNCIRRTFSEVSSVIAKRLQQVAELVPSTGRSRALPSLRSRDYLHCPQAFKVLRKLVHPRVEGR